MAAKGELGRGGMEGAEDEQRRTLPFRMDAGHPWWFSSYDSALPKQWAQVQSLARKLDTCGN